MELASDIHVRQTPARARMDQPESEMATPMPSVRALPNGPYLVDGDVPLVGKAAVATEHGEPLAWQRGPELDHPTTYVLCRCGGSSNKPFCDGTHARNGFDGTETADPSPRASTRKALPGTGIVVYDDRSICEHAGFCGTRATNVWKMVADTADTGVRSLMIAMIERCPSGALSYAFTPDGDDNEPALPAEIGIIADGPLWLTGGIDVETSAGTKLETRNRVTLCRCGGSKHKPLCDGTHKEIGFSHRVDGPPSG